MKRIMKNLPKLAALAATMFVIAACSDQGATAPVAKSDPTLQAAVMPAIAAQGAVVAEQVETPVAGNHGTFAATYPANSITYQFWYDPRYDGTYILGTHMVAFPRYTICDPATSGYGPGYWQSSCAKLTSPILITATTWTDSQGRPQIDFANSIRFYPNYYNQLPAIYLRDPWASFQSWGRIDYCSFNGSCVDEAASDPALTTQRDWATGYLFRLIRHFSGYNVWA